MKNLLLPIPALRRGLMRVETIINPKVKAFVKKAAAPLLFTAIGFGFANPDSAAAIWGFDKPKEEQLYLLDKAAIYVTDTKAFEAKVREVATRLQVPPEWLMATIHYESKFNAGVKNGKGSGATGLIQFMPATAIDLGTSVYDLETMPAHVQMIYVEMYLQRITNKYGRFESLPQLYLGVFYPKALGHKDDYCYSIAIRGSKTYAQNTINDHNKNGDITISDIDGKFASLYPTAYIVPAPFDTTLVTAK